MPKKTTKKTIKKTSVKPVMKEIPLPDPYCHCTKRKRNTILTCVFAASLLLGMFIAHMFFCPVCPHKAKPHVQFDENGCAVVESIKCPKMLESLPMIDVNHDGCITKQEMDLSKRGMRHRKPVAYVQQPAVVDAIAPVMED